MSPTTVYVIHSAGKFWRRRYGRTKSGWVVGLQRASLYHRTSDARRALTLMQDDSAAEVWEVEFCPRKVVLSIASHPVQNRVCAGVPFSDAESS